MEAVCHRCPGMTVHDGESHLIGPTCQSCVIVISRGAYVHLATEQILFNRIDPVFICMSGAAIDTLFLSTLYADK